MASCRDYGPGWSGEFPNCKFDPIGTAGQYTDPGFQGTVESLGYDELLPEQVKGTPWDEYFDPYDPTKERMATRAAGVDVSQLGEAWELAGRHLGESWGANIASTVREGVKARSKANLAYSGSIEEGVRRGLHAGEILYGQELEKGEMQFQQASTDVYQRLAQDVFAAREAWEREQRSTLNTLLGMDIYDGDGGGGDGGGGGGGGDGSSSGDTGSYWEGGPDADPGGDPFESPGGSGEGEGEFEYWDYEQEWS